MRKTEGRRVSFPSDGRGGMSEGKGVAALWCLAVSKDMRYGPTVCYSNLGKGKVALPTMRANLMFVVFFLTVTSSESVARSHIGLLIPQVHMKICNCKARN